MLYKVYYPPHRQRLVYVRITLSTLLPLEIHFSQTSGETDFYHDGLIKISRLLHEGGENPISNCRHFSIMDNSTLQQI